MAAQGEPVDHPYLEWGVAGCGLLLAVIGWVVHHGTYLAVGGVLIALTAILLWVWGGKSLDGVSYVRTLAKSRAMFGERVSMDVEIVNDKILPLTWLQVREEMPVSLGVEGASVVTEGWRSQLQFVVSMRPYQRLRRRLTIVCTQRGQHVFGPGELRSASPLGTLEQRREVREEMTLLVYPKTFVLRSPLAAARVPVADRRVRHSLSLDPNRVVGVRPYVAGDPVRHIDWRATARGTDVLVRVHEPATTLSVAVFVDLVAPPRTPRGTALDLTELVVSVAASMLRHLADLGIPTGVFVTGTATGRPVAVSPSSAPGALATMLELLAKVTPDGGAPVERLLAQQRERLGPGVSVLVVAPDFPEATMVAIADVRRRAAVSALWISTEKGRPPPSDLVDASWCVPYDADWKDRDVLDLGA